jgi:uncharacterized delta-60 repeat protein
MKAISQLKAKPIAEKTKHWLCLGLGIFVSALPLHAQVSVNGSWSGGSGTWGGDLNQWATTAPFRAADLSLTRKAVATATASRNARGEITAINLINGGSGYTTPPRVIIAGGTTGGYGARAEASISGAGVITGIKLISKGGGYSAAPTVTITSELAQVTVLRGGSGYTGIPNLFFQNGGAYSVPPTVTFTTGTGASATAVRTLDKITAINPTNVGIGYGVNSTQVTITGGGGTGATATPVITGDINIDVSADINTDLFTVAGAAPANDTPVEFSGSDVPPGGISLTQRYFVIDSSGSSFRVATSVAGTAVDLITTAGNSVVFTSTAGFGRVVGFVITNQGSGYTGTPAVNISVVQPTVAASAVAVIDDGVVTGVEILSGGEGYLDPPQVRFSAGSGEVGIVSHAGTEAIAVIQDGEVTDVSVTAPGGAGGVVSTVSLTPEGAIDSISLQNPGYGFTSTPTMDFARTYLRTAQVSAVRGLSGNFLSQIQVTNPGAGYVSAPAVTINTNGWQGYTSAPRVSFISNGIKGAIASATRSGNTISAVSVQDGGDGYLVAPTVSFQGGGGTGAAATANISNGRVTSVTMNSVGSGYTSTPIVAFTSNGVTYPVATSNIVSGKVAPTLSATGLVTTAALTILYGGTGHVAPPAVAMTAPSNGGIAATAVAGISGAGVVNSLTLSPGGEGYLTPPAVSFDVNGVTGARATAALSGNTISSVSVDDPGDGYVLAPTVNFTGGGGTGAAATANLTGNKVTSVTMTAVGSGYTSTPTVTFTSNGAGATATATLKESAVSAVTIQNGGDGYVVAPSVSFVGGGGTGAIARATLNGNKVASVTITSGGSGYTSAPTVVFISNGVTFPVVSSNISSGKVTTFTINRGGSGFVAIPRVTIAPVPTSALNATATSSLTADAVTSLTLTNAGQGYFMAPRVTFTTGGIRGAVAAANVSVTNTISSVSVQDGGSGYTVAPTVGFVGGGGTGATATANLSGSRVSSITVTSPGSGYTSAPIVTFTVNGVTYPIVTASIADGKVTSGGFTIVHGGAGLVSAPAVSMTSAPINSTTATANANVIAGAVNSLTLTTGGGAIPAAATAVLSRTGTIDSINITQSGTGYTANPRVTLAAPTGFVGNVYPAPGGIGSYVYFNNDIGGNATISLEAARTVGVLTIGDPFNGEDFTLSAGSGGLANSLTLAMGGIGGGKSFINKNQGDQDVISALVIADEQLNIRVNSGRLTLSGGLAGTGDFVNAGNGTLAIRGSANSSTADLWLQNRGGTGTGAQVELGVTGGSAFGNVRIGSASLGSGGNAVLQLLENRLIVPSLPTFDQGNQIGDMTTVVADGASGRLAYLKLMGGDETIGNIIDVGSSLVLENMEGETVNRNAVLTLGGNNLDSFIGGFVRNRGSGSGTGKLGITKNGTGSLTLRGGNINYTGSTLLNGGTLNLVNTSNFASSITAAAGTRLNIDTLTSSISFDDSVLGAADLNKYGTGNLNFNSGAASLNSLHSYEGTVSFRSGAGTLRGEKAEIRGDLLLRGTPGLSKALSIGSSLSAGNLTIEGGRRDILAVSSINGQIFNSNNIGSAFDAVVEATDRVNISSAALRLSSVGSSIDRVVQTSANGTSLTLTDVSNLVVDSILTLSTDTNNNPSTGVTIPANTRVLAINQSTRTLTLSNSVIIPSGRKVSINYSSTTDGAIRGESLNFADVVHDGRQFVAVTSKGTIHTSLDGQLWDQRYKDPAGVPFSSISWTGERLVVVGDLGRILTSGDGLAWTLQDAGNAVTLNGVTTSNLSFSGDLNSGSATIQNVTNASNFVIGTPVFGFVTSPSSRMLSSSTSGATVVMDSNALATGTDVDFGFFRGTTSTTTTPNTITNVKTAQNLVPGMAISSGTLLPLGTTISAVNGPNSTITLSQPAVSGASAGATVRLFTLTGSLTLNSTTIQNVSNTLGMAVGMALFGQGIPSGTVITAINSSLNTIELSQGAIATTTGSPLGIYTGTLSPSSTLVQNVTSMANFRPQMAIQGISVPVGTRVTGTTANTLTISNPARSTVTAANLTQSPRERMVVGTFGVNSALVTGVVDAASLTVGMPVYLPGVTQPGTTISLISGTNVTLSQNAVQSAPAALFRAGFNLMVVGNSGYVATSFGGDTGSWLTRSSGVSNHLNAVSASPSAFVAVGAAGQLITSSDAVTWSNQTPPLNATGLFITDTTSNTATITGTSAAGSGISYGIFKGTASGNNVITNINGAQSIRVGIPVSADSGIPAGTRVSSVDTTSFTMTTPATITELNKPIRTFSALVTAGSALLAEVTDFKGLAVGMALHGTAFNGTETGTIYALYPETRSIWLTRVPPTEGRGNFGVMYGNLSVNSPVVQNVTNMPSIQRRPGTTHFSTGKGVASVAGKIPSNTAVSAYDPVLNQLTLTNQALSSANEVPLLTFTGTTSNNSSIITNVVDFSELTEGMVLLVTGDAQGTANVVPYLVTLLDDANDTIYLNSFINLNVANGPVKVALGIYTGSITAGSQLVTKIRNANSIPLSLPKLDDVVWTGSQFVAVGDYGAILTSPTGSVWTPQNSATGLDLSAVAVANGQILVAGQDGVILSSSNGVTWSETRKADSAALNDLRAVDRIKTLVSGSGRTVALGNGGLSIPTGGTWGTSLNSTFSGSQLEIGLGGILSIRNEVTYNSRLGPSIVELNQNNTNRIDDAAILNSKGGRFDFSNNGATNTAYSETVGKLLLSQGQLLISTTTAAAGGSSTLRFGSLQLLPGATLNFAARNSQESAEDSALIGASALNRVLFTQAPTLRNGIIGGAVTVGNEWATYDTTNGVKRLDPVTGYETGGVGAWGSTENIKMSVNQTLTTPLVINSLNLTGGTLNLAAFRLSIEAGGILANSGNPTISGTGILTVGTAMNAPQTLNLINNSALTINTPIQDFESKVNLVLSSSLQIGTIQITLPNATALSGLLPGMSVSGVGIAPGTRIESVDSGNRITLTSPTIAIIPTTTELTFRGGSVSLSKSGGGVLTLNSANNYTGKTYINSGTLLVRSLASLGAAPASYVADQIQINGGTFQFGHPTQSIVPSPDLNVNLNDGLRGLTVGIAGGRIEVGTANPDNTSGIPVINLSLTNPMSVVGLLEVAIRSSTEQQFNSLTLGNASSTNTYLAGIQTDVSTSTSNYRGRLIILGNNTIGGINQQGGDVVIEGNNNFTGGIRSTEGNLTIEGSNTWLGGNRFDQAISIGFGILRLKTPDALGTGGLNLNLGTSVLQLGGVSQTIRQITDTSNSSISNTEAPANLTAPTDLIFNIDNNQVLNGRIIDDSFGNYGIRLIKRGPGDLALSNTSNGFSSGIEIQSGSLSVTGISDVGFNTSVLGNAKTDDPNLLLIDKSTLIFNLASRQRTNRSFTMGAGPNGASIVANGTSQEARLIFGREDRDPFTGRNDISQPIGFKDGGDRTLTLGGSGRGDNTLLLELRDKSVNELSALFKLGSGTWVLGKAAPYSGVTTINEGILAVTANNALGTDAEETVVDPVNDTFTGNFANGTQINFPLFLDTTLPGGVLGDNPYYVVNFTPSVNPNVAPTFQIAATVGGAALPITSAGSNVRFVPKIDSFRTTFLDVVADTFTGSLINGDKVTFNGQIVGGVISQLPAGLLVNTYYYVRNAAGGTFQISETETGPIFDLTTEGTRGGLYYAVQKVGNPSGGVNLTSGTLLLQNVNYVTPESLNLNGGILAAPIDSHSTWAGNVQVNTLSTINVGLGGSITLSGNLTGTDRLFKQGEGSLILQGETIMPTTNSLNSTRQFYVNAGTLVLDYSLNNGSKLVDNAFLVLGGSRRGGEIVLTGGNHEEIVGRTQLSSGASRIYRNGGTSTLRLNLVDRLAGSSLYVDTGRLVKTDQPNTNGLMGAWAIVRDAVTNAFWVIPGTTSYTYTTTADPSNDRLTIRDINNLPLPHTLANGTLVRFSSTGVLPGGLSANTSYYVFDTAGTSDNAALPARIGTLKVALLPGNTVSPVDITSAGTGVLTMTSQITFTVNAQSDTLTSAGEHRLAKGGIVRVASYGSLPGGLSTGVDYYLIDVTTRSFRLSLAVDGTPVNITDIGNGIHTVESQGVPKRAGSSALTFVADASNFPATEGNGKIQVAITPLAGPGEITATLTGNGTLATPYVYTIFTTEEKNSNTDIVTYVNNDTQRAGIFSVALSGGNDWVNAVKDLGSYGAPTFLSNGSFDNGNTELDWARNEAIGGLSNDGFVMPNGEYVPSWAPTSNTAVTQNLTISTPAGRDTYSLRFATQNASTVNLNNTAVNTIRSSGILISPTVGANDSAINGTGSLSIGGESNLQNLLVHQYNELGSLNIGAKIVDRAAVQRVGRLTGSIRNTITLDDVSGVSVGHTITGAGISANTTVSAIDVSTRVIKLSQNHNGQQFTAVNYSFFYTISGVASTTSTFELTLSSVAGLGVGYQVSGTGITNGSLITAIDSGTKVVTLSIAHDGVVRPSAVAYTFLSVIQSGIASDPNRRYLAGVVNAKNISPGMTVTGPGLFSGTTVVTVDKINLIVTLSRDHDGFYRRGDYVFDGNITSRASTADSYPRRIIGLVKPGNGIPNDPSEVGTVATSDLYIGMPLSGPGIPFGSFITSIYGDGDIEVAPNHFFTGESSLIKFTPSTGVEKLGAGTLVLSGDNQYTGVTYIGEGTLRVQKLSDGGISGSLGTSSAASSNLFFNGAELQYVGESARTNRGFQLADSAIFNIGHEKTTATFSGAVVGTDRFEKQGPGTLVFNGNAGLESFRVEQGRLLLQTVDTNPSPGTFSPTNFSTTNLTSLRVAGGVLELRGTPEGNVAQTFGSTFYIEEGASELKVTSVESFDPNNLVATTNFRSTTLNLMGQEESADFERSAGGTVRFTLNPETTSAPAKIFLASKTKGLLTWATFQNLGANPFGGVNEFAFVSSTGEITSGNSSLITITNTSDWAGSASSTQAFDNVSEVGSTPFTGNITSDRFVNSIRYESSAESTINISAGKTLEILSGAILMAFDVNGSQKKILGPGSITGGTSNGKNIDFIVHNYNPASSFTIGAGIKDRSKTAQGYDLGQGSLIAGQPFLKVSFDLDTINLLLSLQIGTAVSGPGIAAGTVVTRVDADNQIIGLSLPALSNQTGGTFSFTEALNLVQVGVGTTILSGNNIYTGKTFVHGGVLRLDSANAVPGGIARTGGTSPIVVEGGIVGLGAGDFSRILGTGNDQIEFKGNGGFAAYGADRSVNLGGAGTPERLRFGNLGFVPDGSSLMLSSADATHKLTFQNPLDLGTFSQAINVGNGAADVDAELAGDLSGLGRLVKFGLGTLRLGVSNTNSGGLEIADGRVIAANVPNVFGLTGSTTGSVKLGTSRTNTSTGAGIDLQIEGGTINKKLEVGAVNSSSSSWQAGGQVDNSPAILDVGSESKMILVDGTPTIAYYDATNKDLKYVHSTDARGTSWNVPITVASRGNVGKYPSLQVINGNPAITYYDETNKTLMYVRALDVPGATWGNPTPILAPNVLAVAAQSDGKILVAGSFTRFDGDNNKRRMVRLQPDAANPNNWVIDPAFNSLVVQNGEVRDILVQANGKIIIGGTFTTLRNTANTNDVTRSRLARLNADGSLDESFNQNLNGDVRVIFELADQKFMVGGAFTNVSGVTRARLARFNQDGSLDNAFNSPDIRNGEVRTIGFHNVPMANQTELGAYVIGGNFSSVRGTDNRNRLARINLTGGLDSGFNPDANSDVNALVVLPNNQLLVGGSFGAFAGGNQSRTRLARLNENGTLDNSFAQEVNGTVNRLILERSGNVLVSGTFSILGDFQRAFIGRVLADGNVDPVFNPDPNFEVRDLIVQQAALQADDKILLGGIFTNIGGGAQAAVSRIGLSGVKDTTMNHTPLDTGMYNSLLSVNGNPAVCYYEAANKDLEYVRSTDVNGSSWPNPQLIDASGDVGVGTNMIIANIGGDVLIKDNFGTPTDVSDDEVTISANSAGVTNSAIIGTPVIAYGDATNSKINYVVANNSTGDVNTFPVTNWSTPQRIPLLTSEIVNLPQFSLKLVDGFPALAYQTIVDPTPANIVYDLRFIRATNAAGLGNNLRDPTDSSIQKIKVTALNFPIISSWGSSSSLDSTGKAGWNPSLAMVNGQPTTTRDRPAVSYYDSASGDLKIKVSTTPEGTNSGTVLWAESSTLASSGDVGMSSSLLMSDGLQAVSYYNATDGDLAFLIRSDAGGYSRISFTGNTTWSGSVDLQGAAIFSPAAGQIATVSGLISGVSGFKLVGDGILNLTNAANLFGTSLSGPKQTTGPGKAVNGAVVIRSGTLQFSGTTGLNSTTALGSSTIELGDATPTQVLTADRATDGKSMLLNGGVFSVNHNGSNGTVGGPGVFVKVGSTIDGKFFGLRSTIANAGTERFTGNAANGTIIRFVGEILPIGVQSQLPYYVVNKSGATFQVSATLNGSAIDLSSTGSRFYYYEQDILTTIILVKDEEDHPERNGLYQFVVNGDVTSLSESEINLIRVSTFDSPSEMSYGSKVSVTGGTSAGKSFYLLGDVTDLNLSPVNWVDDAANSNRALLATVAGLTVTNAIDVNANAGTSTLGVLNTVTSGQVTFTGPMTMQNLSTAMESQAVELTSFISSGPGLVYQGVISEADGGALLTNDQLSLIKSGSGVLTLSANNTFGGGITVNAGTLLVMNTPVNVSDSGTGTGTVTLNPGTVLGGIGSISGAVNLSGTPGNQAVLRPGDPNSSSAAVETLTIKGPITVGADSVIEFKIGVSNMTKLAGTTIHLATETSRIVVTADPGFLPAVGTEFDLLDLNAGGFTIFGDLTNLINLLQLPAATVWDTTQFLTTGKIIADGNAVPVVITTHPVGRTVTQGDNVTFSVQFTGTGPNTFQWYNGTAPVLGATNQTLTLNGVTQADEGNYTVRVFSPLNPAPVGVSSNPATLVVDWPLSFAVDLSSTRVGSRTYGITFTVVMNGEGAPFTYQWKKGSTNIGTNSNTLTLSGLSIADEGAYSVVVTGPSLSVRPVNSVTSTVSTLTTVDGPGVAAPPSPAPAAEGGDVQLAAALSGDVSLMTLQWLRNGVPVPGATSATLTLCGVTVAGSSGDYTLRVTAPGPNGKPVTVISSPPTTVIIVDNAPKILAGQIGKTVTLVANAGSTKTVSATAKPPTQFYQWFKNNGPLPGDGRFTGGNTKSLKITNLGLSDTDVYTCRITTATSTTPVTAGTTHLRVYDAAPVLASSLNPPKGMVGGFYSWKIPVISDVPTPSSGPNPAAWKTTPERYVVTGLPPGLTPNPTTGFITGYPTAATSTPKEIKITVSNGVKPGTGVTTNTATALIDIKPLPLGIVGSYIGPISRHAGNGNLGGRFEMTVLSTGAMTGKVTAGSVSARSFKGGFNINLDSAGNLVGLIGTKIMLPGVTGAEAMDLQFDLQTTAAVAPAVAPSTFIVNATAKPCGSSTGAVITAWRNKWAAKAVVGISDVPTAYVGTPLIPAIAAKPATTTTPAVPAVPAVPATTGPYNFLMALPQADPLLSNAFVPKGTGYASFTVLSTGSCTIAGRTADGMPITGSYLLGPTGQLFFFQSLYGTTTKGSLLGNLQVELAASPLDNDVSGNFSWVRPPDPRAINATTSRLYRSGFGTTQVLSGITPTTVTTPVQLVALGGRYVAPPTTGTAPLKVLMGLDPYDPTQLSPQPNAELVFNENGDGVTPVVSARNPNIDVMIAARSATTTPTFKEPTATNSTPNPNPAATRVSPTASTGAFTGTFTLIDPGATATTPLRRPVTFQGLIIRQRTSAPNVLPKVFKTYGQGYFIINQLPLVGQPNTTVTQQLSGVVEFKGR